MRELFAFPNPVNELSARLVAGGVVLLCIATIAFDQPWLFVVLAYGFVARVLTGPTLSPLGQFVTRVLTPRLSLPPKFVPGPPKRFAQGVGAVTTVTAAVLHFAFAADVAALAVLGLIVVAAALESMFAVCVGCTIFAALLRAGVIPVEMCAECADVARRMPRAA
jgi:hypothetical protein